MRFIYNEKFVFLDTTKERNEVSVDRIDNLIIEGAERKESDLKREIDAFAMSFGDSINKTHVYPSNIIYFLCRPILLRKKE